MTNWRRQVNEARAQLMDAYARRPFDLDAANTAINRLKVLMAQPHDEVALPQKIGRPKKNFGNDGYRTLHSW